MITASDELRPDESVTVRLITFCPVGRTTDGVAPEAVPKGPVQVKLNGSPFGSDELLPSRSTVAIQLGPQAIVWSGPALAMGSLLNSNAPISITATPLLSPSKIL